MKKIIITFLFIALPILLLNAQKIDKDYYDQFTGKRVMYTKLEKINWQYKNDRIGGRMQIRFILNGDFQYLLLHWNCKNYLEIPANALIQVRLDNGHIINLKNENHTVATRGGTGISKKDIGVMLNCLGNIPEFATALVTAIRIHTSEGYYDFNINKKDAIKIHKTHMLFSKQKHVGGAY